MRKSTLILVIAIAIVCIFTIGVFSVFKKDILSPYDFLVKEIGNNNTRMPAEMLYEINIDDREHLIFYKDQRGIVACAIIKKKPLSYSLLRISSGIWPHISEDPVNSGFKLTHF